MEDVPDIPEFPTPEHAPDAAPEEREIVDAKRRKIHPSEEHLSKAQLRERSVLRTLVARHRRPLTWYMTLAMVNEAIHMFVPVAIGLIIDWGIIAQNLSLAFWGTLGVIALRLVANAAWSHFFYRIMRLRTEEQHNLRLAVTAAALDPASRPVDRPAGEILSIATSDADRAPDLFDMMTWAVPAAIAVVGAGVWLTWVNPWVGLVVFIGLALQVVALRVITPILSQKYDAQQSHAADAAATATDLVHGLRVLQGLGVQTRAREMYRERSRIALDAALVNARFSGLSNGVMTFVSTMMISAVVLIAGALTMEGALSVGLLISMVGLVRNLSGMMDGLSGVPVWWASFSTSARRVRQLLSEMGRSLNEPALSQMVERSSVQALTGATEVYGSGLPRRGGIGSLRTPVLGEVRDGELVALVPGTAADARLALEELSLTGLSREDMLMEPHAVDVFDGTLREQLATRAPREVLEEGSDVWAHEALRSAGADDLLDILSDGLDTRIMDRGANLSGGQRQRLALARAVAADTPALVLHDPTTAVDAVTEQRIAESLAAARKRPDRVTVLVTKAPALLAQSDRVVFVQRGTKVAEGSHRDLMNDSMYAEVVQR